MKVYPFFLFALASLNAQVERDLRARLPTPSSAAATTSLLIKPITWPSTASIWHVPGQVAFSHAPAPGGWYRSGFELRNDSSDDWHEFYGIQFDVLAPAGRTVEIEVTLHAPPPDFVRQDVIDRTTAQTTALGGEWRRVTLPWSVFDYNQRQGAFLWFIRELSLTAKFSDGSSGGLRFKNVQLVRAPQVALIALLRGQAVGPGETANYQVQVGNCTDQPQAVALTFEKQGWEAMTTTVMPAQLQLAPGQSAAVTVSVVVPSAVPPGGHERQRLVASTQGAHSGIASVELITARDVPRPFLMHTAEEWAEVRQKVQHYDWARASLAQDFVAVADRWQVPFAPRPPHLLSDGHRYVFRSEEFKTLETVSVAWQVTRERKYAEKVALFLRRLADEKTGYPATLAAVSQDQPQEGENMQRVAIAYDAVLDAGVLSAEDRQSIDRTLRLYMKVTEVDLNEGNVGNWNTALGTAALFGSLVIGDLTATERYLYGPTGFTDFLSKSVMDDGWWWECATGYNLWCAAELTQTALACRPWGIDVLHLQVPTSYSPHTIIDPFAVGTPVFGVKFEKWGPVLHNTREIKMLWDALPRAVDYRGILFGLSDGHEERLTGPRIELGYYAFRDPAYASIIRLLPKRDLVYGVAELPAETPPLGVKSGYAANIGYTLLRSQTAARPVREQIQAVLKFGSHGGYHGHFDRTALNTLERYGRSFYNPESIWQGYPSTLYKFYVQTSVAHNMVVVDGKMQEAVPSEQLLFHSGPMMQAAVVETNARWSDPPYGGMVYKARETLADRQWDNGQSYPIVTDRAWGDMGAYSERVLQRRLMIVTDDYVVLADALKGSQPHTFDHLLQMKGFEGMTAPGKTFLRHDAQYDANPHSSGQFITDADWYRAQAPAVAQFKFTFGRGEETRGSPNYYNEPGVLNLAVHSAWPLQQEIMLATPPESLGESQRVTYELDADSLSVSPQPQASPPNSASVGGARPPGALAPLQSGRSGVWILGQVDLDVPIEGQTALTLKLTTEGARRQSLFLANARVLDAAGVDHPLTGPFRSENISTPPATGHDYYGGPIKIAGNLCPAAIPVQPDDEAKPALLHIPLGSAGAGAVRFRATLGGDYPFGDERQRRKIYAIRTVGSSARFLTVIEPYENQALVRSAVATGPDHLRVELADGRVQEIAIQNLDGDGRQIHVDLTESSAAGAIRNESARN